MVGANRVSEKETHSEAGKQVCVNQVQTLLLF